MSEIKKTPIQEKTRLHIRNKHRERYNFKELIKVCPELKSFVKPNIYKENSSDSIDFFNPDAVKMLNKSLLKLYYGINNWDIPNNYLCPGIPGRADYIHHIADVLAKKNSGIVPIGTKFKCLDIGVGANCVYPIIGNHEYGWSFVGTETDTIAIESAQNIVQNNPQLIDKIEIRLQQNPKDIFYGAIEPNEYYDLTICNPPFHSSFEDAQAKAVKKLNNLKKTITNKTVLNFGGQNNELWCDGGERKFVLQMIRQSKRFSKTCFWFSTLLSKQSNLKVVQDALQENEAIEVKTIPMGQGNKASRLIAWTFLTPEEQKDWVKKNWN